MGEAKPVLKGLQGGRYKNQLQTKRMNEEKLFTTEISNMDFNSDIYSQIEVSASLEKDEGEGEAFMKEFASKNELEALKELINTSRDYDNRIHEERANRLNERIDHGNQLLTQKIDASNELLASRFELISKDIENMTSTLTSKFENELEARFSAERKAREAETKETRKWLWTIWIAVIIGIVQIIISLIN